MATPFFTKRLRLVPSPTGYTEKLAIIPEAPPILFLHYRLHDQLGEIQNVEVNIFPAGACSYGPETLLARRYHCVRTRGENLVDFPLGHRSREVRVHHFHVAAATAANGHVAVVGEFYELYAWNRLYNLSWFLEDAGVSAQIAGVVIRYL